MEPGPFTILAPVTGRVVRLDEVPDPVFSQRMLGDGLAIDPAEGLAVAPVSGTVHALLTSGHAVGIRTDAGLEVLVHLGIESVKLAGIFRPLVAPGHRVTAGQPLIQFDLDGLRRLAASALSPVMALQLEEGWRVVPLAGPRVRAGVDLLFVVRPASPLGT